MGMPIAREAVEARPRRARRSATRPRGDGGQALAAMRRLAADLDLETGDLLGATVLHEVTHRVLARQGSGAAHPLETARRRMARAADAPDVAGTLRAFRPAFPTASPLPDPAVEGGTAGARTAAGRALEELVLLRLNATNPALRGVRRLFDDAELAASTDYLRIIDALDTPAEAPTVGERGRAVTGQAGPRAPAPAARPDRGVTRLARRPAAVGPSPLGVRADPRGPSPPHPGARPAGGGGPRAQPARARYGWRRGSQRGPRARLRRRGRALLHRRPLDAPGGAAGQERVRLAGAALTGLWAGHHDAGPGPRRGAGRDGGRGCQRALADRPVGA